MRVKKMFASVAAGALLAGFPLVAATPAAAQEAPAAPGAFADAFGLLVDATALAGNVPVQAGPISEASSSCPPEVGADEAEVLDVALPDDGTVAKSETLLAQADTNCPAEGPDAFARAITEGASVLNPDEPAGTDIIPGLLTAEVIDAQATATCEGLTGTTDFVGLTITNPNDPTQAVDVPADPPPNTRIDIPGVATIILNEQNFALSEDGGTVVVNGVHIIGASALLRGDIIISHAVAGVAGCPDGPPEPPVDVDPPTITFEKDAVPATANPGDTVTYTATVNNSGEDDCDVLKLIDHLNPVFEFVSTTGDFGEEAELEQRGDGGSDVVLRPTETVIAAGESATQTFVVRVRPNAGPGTYYNVLEIFCSQQGNFVSPPIAPVTIPGECADPFGDATKTVTSPTVRPGQEFSYVIEVSNGCDVPINDVVVRDTPHADLEFVRATGTVTPPGRTIPEPTREGADLVFAVGTVEPDAVVRIVLTFRVPTNAQPGTEYRNVAVITGQDGGPHTKQVEVRGPRVAQGPLPRTGAAALLPVLGLVTIGGAFLARRRFGDQG